MYPFVVHMCVWLILSFSFPSENIDNGFRRKIVVLLFAFLVFFVCLVRDAFFAQSLQ